jgi:hypothetical protein
MPLHLHKDPYIQMLPHIVFYISECFFMFIFGQFPQGWVLELAVSIVL